MNNEIEISQTFESLPQAVEALCLKVFGAKPLYPLGMFESKQPMTAETEMIKICTIMTGHCPREICTTVEAVQWLVDRHKAATAANLKLDEIRTEKLATRGLVDEANAVSAARLILRKSKRIADEMADGTPERPAENDEWWHRRDQAPIQLETLSPVATHGLLALLLMFVNA